MLYVNRPQRLYLYGGIIDFRKQINGLAQVIEADFPVGSLMTSWFVFISRDKKRVKILYWRGAGLALWHYRLEKASFTLPRPRPLSSRNISWHELERFINGYNIFIGEAHATLDVKSFV